MRPSRSIAVVSNNRDPASTSRLTARFGRWSASRSPGIAERHGRPARRWRRRSVRADAGRRAGRPWPGLRARPCPARPRVGTGREDRCPRRAPCGVPQRPRTRPPSRRRPGSLPMRPGVASARRPRGPRRGRRCGASGRRRRRMPWRRPAGSSLNTSAVARSRPVEAGRRARRPGRSPAGSRTLTFPSRHASMLAR